MRKIAVEKVLAKLPDFRSSGSFYFGTCNEEIMAGFCIDAPPNIIRIWRFIQPTYDQIDFLNMSLGKIVWTLGNDRSDSSAELLDTIQRDWLDFSWVTDGESLGRYLDGEQMGGTYALWARYLTHIWCKEFEAAERLQQHPIVTKKFSEFHGISKQFTELSEIKNRNGWQECRLLLEAWRQVTKSSF